MTVVCSKLNCSLYRIPDTLPSWRSLVMPYIHTTQQSLPSTHNHHGCPKTPAATPKNASCQKKTGNFTRVLKEKTENRKSLAYHATEVVQSRTDFKGNNPKPQPAQPAEMDDASLSPRLPQQAATLVRTEGSVPAVSSCRWPLLRA